VEYHDSHKIHLTGACNNTVTGERYKGGFINFIGDYESKSLFMQRVVNQLNAIALVAGGGRNVKKRLSEQKDVIIKKDECISPKGHEIRENGHGGYAVFYDGKATGFESMEKSDCEKWIRLKKGKSYEYKGYEIRENSYGGYSVFCDGKATGFESMEKSDCEKWIDSKR
jgi:hypothetical protein